MKNLKLSVTFATAWLALIAPAHAILVTNNVNAASLASAFGGSGITISNATLTSNVQAPSGLFTGGLNSVGFTNGIVLTNGTTACVSGPNNATDCSGTGETTSLKFNFTSTSALISFKYVFASEEYNEFVGSDFSDSFEILLNGINLAVLPGAGGAVNINSINCFTNSAFYRNNDSDRGSCLGQNLDLQYDGLTTVLTASGSLLSGLNTLEFVIRDELDSDYDSALFIQAGTVLDPGPGQELPEPGILALMGLALVGQTAIIAALKKRKLCGYRFVVESRHHGRGRGLDRVFAHLQHRASDPRRGAARL